MAGIALSKQFPSQHLYIRYQGKSPYANILLTSDWNPSRWAENLHVRRQSVRHEFVTQGGVSAPVQPVLCDRACWHRRSIDRCVAQYRMFCWRRSPVPFTSSELIGWLLTGIYATECMGSYSPEDAVLAAYDIYIDQWRMFLVIFMYICQSQYCVKLKLVLLRYWPINNFVLYIFSNNTALNQSIQQSMPIHLVSVFSHRFKLQGACMPRNFRFPRGLWETLPELMK